MRRRFPRSVSLPVVLVFLAVPPGLRAQDVEARIAEIRTLYGAIEARLDGYRVTRKEYHDMAVAGTVEAWWEGDEARKVVVRFDADGSSGRTEYFFHGGRLFFAFDLWETFPLWPGDDPDDFGPTENRFYFDDAGLVRWLVRSHESGMVNEAVPPTTEGYLERGYRIEDDARLYRAFAADEEEDLDEFRASWSGGEGQAARPGQPDPPGGSSSSSRTRASTWSMASRVAPEEKPRRLRYP